MQGAIYRAAQAILGVRAQGTNHGEIPGRFLLREWRTREEEGEADRWGRAVGGSAGESGPSGVTRACRGWLVGPGWSDASRGVELATRGLREAGALGWADARVREGGRGWARGEKGTGPRGEGEEREEEGWLGWARAEFAGPG